MWLKPLSIIKQLVQWHCILITVGFSLLKLMARYVLPRVQTTSIESEFDWLCKHEINYDVIHTGIAEGSLDITLPRKTIRKPSRAGSRYLSCIVTPLSLWLGGVIILRELFKDRSYWGYMSVGIKTIFINIGQDQR